MPFLAVAADLTPKPVPRYSLQGTGQSGARVTALGAVAHLASRMGEGLSVSIEEFARLANGEVLSLRMSRGFSSSERASIQEPVGRRSLLASIGMTLMPDEAEPEFSTDDENYTGDPIPWTALAELLAERGVDVTPDRLRSLPYIIEFAPELEAMIDPEK